MPTETHSRSVIRAPGASAELRLDQTRRVQITVHSESGLPAARATAGLVRQAVLDASTHGVETIQISLDVSTPACGIVLGELQRLAAEGLAPPRMRRAGGTVLVDISLTPLGVDRRGVATLPRTDAAPAALVHPRSS